MKKWLLTPYSYLWERVCEPWINDKPLKVKHLNWWGSRYTGKTTQAINLTTLLHLLRPDKKIVFYGVRKKIQNKKELYDTIIEHWPPELSYTGNISNRTIKRPNLYMEILGLAENTKKIAQKLGKTRLKADLTIIVFDEAFEFSNTDYMNVLGAVGLGKNSLIFKCSNPYSKSAPFFKEVLKQNPYKEQIAKEQYQSITEPNSEAINHYLNAYAIWNEGILTDETKKMIEKAELLDPITGRVVKYGEPLTLEGGIYTKELHFINEVLHLPIIDWEIICGIDFGYSNDPSAVFLGAISGDETELIMLDELQIGTKASIYDTTRQASEIFNFLLKNWKKYQWNGTLTIYCENDFAFVETLNKLKDKSNYGATFDGKWYLLGEHIEFERVNERYKKDRINKRIKAVLRAMATNKMYRLKDTCPLLIDELERAEWKQRPDGTRKLERADGDDHLINALEYSLAPYLNTLGSID